MTSPEISELLKRITVIPGLMGGKPVVRGLRFPVSDILEMLASGMSVSDILDQHPILEPEDIRAALVFATIKVNSGSVPLVA